MAGKNPKKRFARIWFEMARRYKQFHAGEDWRGIRLWGLAYKSDIEGQLKRGELIPNSNYAPKALMWVYPSAKAYNEKIKPLLDAYTLEELTRWAGWQV